MTVTSTNSLEQAAKLLADAPSPVVVIPVYNSYDDVVKCFASILAHTPKSHAILIVDDVGSDRRFFDELEASESPITHDVVVLHHERNSGFIGSCNDAFAATPRRDVILVNSDVIVGPEWLERLTAAATSSNLIATASTLTNHGTILSVPERNTPSSDHPGGLSPDEAARRVAAASLQLRPTIPSAIGHCMYIKRRALDVVGGFDPGLGRGYGEEVDFSQRAVRYGFRHVCADDVFTYHRGNASFGAEAIAAKNANDQLVAERYPWYLTWVQQAATDTTSPLAHALLVASIAVRGLVLGLDASCLGPALTGTQRVVLEMSKYLSEQPGVSRFVVFTPPVVPEYAADLMASLSHTEIVPVRMPIEESPTHVDVLVRPFQVNNTAELGWLKSTCDRLIVTQLDIIAYSNPSYFADAEDWLRYRGSTRLTLAAADGAAFISEHALDEIRSEGLLTSDTPTEVVYSGAEFSPIAPTPATLPDPRLGDDAGFLFCLGQSYWHKNRMYALRLWERLRQNGWSGRLVFAGPTPSFGYSNDTEAAWLAERTDLAADLIDLGSIDESTKDWLYQHATLVLYPTIVEGFGLVPFEAASRGAATLSSRQGSLDEVLPADLVTLPSLDPDDAVDLAWSLIHDPAQRSAIVETLRRPVDRFRWRKMAEQMHALALETLRRPATRLAAVQDETGAFVTFDPTNAHPVTIGRIIADRVAARWHRSRLLSGVIAPEGSRRLAVLRRVARVVRRPGNSR